MDGTILKIYKMIITVFFITNQATNIRFFKETFLVANINLDIDLKIFFLTSSGANVHF